jgi:uncharacterized membrane protein (DUF441 family)
MKPLPQRLLIALDHRRLSNSTGAIAGFVSAVSVLLGVVAAHLAPKGWHKLAMSMHLVKKPLIVKMLPVVGGIAVALATAAGLLRFISWCLEREDGREAGDDAEADNDP